MSVTVTGMPIFKKEVNKFQHPVRRAVLKVHAALLCVAGYVAVPLRFSLRLLNLIGELHAQSTRPRYPRERDYGAY